MAPILDGAVWERVESVLLDPEIIAREVARRAASNTLQADLHAIDRRLRTVDEQRKRLAKAISTLEDEEASAPLLIELAALASAARTLKAERVLIERRAEDEAETQRRLNDLSHWCQRVAGNLLTFAYQDKRMVLEALGVSVRVFRADHEPRWEITMAPLPVDPTTEAPTAFSKGAPSSTAIRRLMRNRSTA